MKNIKSYFRISLFLFAGILASSCTDKIDLDLPDGDTFFVVEGWITNIEEQQTVKLSYTSPYFDNSAQPVAAGATVIIGDDLGTDIVLEEIQPGTYAFQGPGEAGRSYQIRITLTDGTNYESNFEPLLDEISITDIFWQLSDDEPNEDDDQKPSDIYEVLINTQEPAGLGNYYRWRSFLNGKENRKPEYIFTVSDEFVDGSAIINFNVTGDLYSASDTVTIIQEHISRRASEFLTLLQAQTAFVGSPFDSPPATIVGNIVNPDDTDEIVLGYFGAAAQSIATTVVAVE